MLTLLKALLTLAVLWLIGQSIDFGEAFDRISELSISTVVCVFALLLVQLLATSERLRIALSMLKCSVKYRVAFRANAEGNFFSHTFISVLGSDAARIWRCHRSGIALKTATGGVLLDRLIGLSINHLMLLAALPFIWERLDDDWTRSGLGLVAVGFSGALILVYILGVIRLPDSLLKRISSGRLQIIYDLARISGAAISSGFTSLAAVAFSLIIATVNIAIFYVLLANLGSTIGFLECVVIVPIVIQISLLPISIGGWGLRESAAVVGFSCYGVDGHLALAASILFGLLMLIFSLWGGVLWWMDHSSANNPID